MTSASYYKHAAPLGQGAKCDMLPACSYSDSRLPEIPRSPACSDSDSRLRTPDSRL
jgi:hypothetical protein